MKTQNRHVRFLILITFIYIVAIFVIGFNSYGGINNNLYFILATIAFGLGDIGGAYCVYGKNPRHLLYLNTLLILGATLTIFLKVLHYSFAITLFNTLATILIIFGIMYFRKHKVRAK